MIELGRLRIETEASIVDARNKIRGLAGSLGFDGVAITRLATFVSELCRKAIETHEFFHLEIALDQRESRAGLALIFNECVGPQLNALASTCFDRVQEIHAADGAVRLFTIKWITDPGFEPSEEFIAQERNRISQLSKADQLLRVILPSAIAEELRGHNERGGWRVRYEASHLALHAAQIYLLLKP